MGKMEQIERTFSMPDGCQLDVHNVSGSIVVTGGEGDQVHIVAVKRSRRWQEAEATEIDIGQEGRRVWARTRVHRRKDWRRLWGGGAASVDYAIELPRQSQVKVSSISASTDVSSMEGQVTIHSVSGSVLARHIHGPLHIESVSASVSGHALQGQLRLETVSGKVDLAESDFNSLRTITVSGPLKIATSLHPAGEYRAQTVSGNVELLLPATSNCTVEGHSVSGRLRTSLAHSPQRQRFGTWRIEVGHGGVPLRFDSVSGDLILTVVGERAAVQAAGGEASEVAAQAEPEVTPTTMGILRAIEMGQLSVEEGLAKLRQVKEGTEAQHGKQ